MKRLVLLSFCALTLATCAADSRPHAVLTIADDASWRHFGANGDKVCRTPNFDRVAREGVNFTRAFCSSPSCTPSRGALLTGQDFWRLEQGANLWSHWPNKFAVYPDLLARQVTMSASTARDGAPAISSPAGATTIRQD